LYILLIEVALHYEYYYSINQYRAFQWIPMPPWEVAWAGYFTLNFMFTKFLVIWRFFRLWALGDGIDTIENMNRCVNNNYTFQGFWRQWHASLNGWIVRYLYVPLGGSKSQVWSIWIIFTFIGIWHDLWWRWIAWAWLNCIFFSGERAVQALFHSHRFAWLRLRPTWHRRVVALAGGFNIHLLMLANLAILHGFDGSWVFLKHSFVREGGVSLFVMSSFYLSSATMFMLALRERESRLQKERRF